MIGLLAALAGLVLAAGAAAVQFLPRSFSQAQRQQIMAWEIGKRWRDWPAGRIFPSAIGYELQGSTFGGGPSLALRAERVGIAEQASCRDATEPAVGPLLTKQGCLAVLRATYQDATQTFAVTVGVAVMPASSASSAGKASAALRHAVGPPPWLRAVSFRHTTTAHFAGPGHKVGCERPRGPVPGAGHRGLCRRQAVAQAGERQLHQGRDGQPGGRGRPLGGVPARRLPAGTALPGQSRMLRLAPRARRWRTLAGVLAALLAAPAVAVGSAGTAQADPVRQQELWVLNAINVAGAWQHTHGSGVTVALIDSGVNGQVSDLSGSVTTGRDFSGVNTPPTDANWGVHGTWMASLIAGHGHAGGSSGIMGVAPAAKILSIRAVTDQGDPGYRHYQHESESRVQGHLAEAIRYATSKRVSVISMSLGYQGASRQVRVAISDALAQGIVVVASSGNSGGASSGAHGNAPYSFPADYPGVLGVGAVAQNGLPAGFSSDNLSVQVAAPGVRVPAQGRDGQYWLVSGTSPACALTAGAAALIKSVYPALAPALVVQAITSSTSNKPHGSYDEEVGFGTVDATAALKMAGRLARDRGTGRGLVAAAQVRRRHGGHPAGSRGRADQTAVPGRLADRTRLPRRRADCGVPPDRDPQARRCRSARRLAQPRRSRWLGRPARLSRIGWPGRSRPAGSWPARPRPPRTWPPRPRRLQRGRSLVRRQRDRLRALGELLGTWGL